MPAEAALGGRPVRTAGPWRSALRRLRRQPVAVGALVVFALMLAASLAAPLYADHVAGIGPTTG